jgi:methionine biosynthesis protein MetW
MRISEMWTRLAKVHEYLFHDYDFLSRFNSSLDYASYRNSVAKMEMDRQKDPVLSGFANKVISSRYELIAGLVQSKSRVLEIGCGDGSLLAYLREVNEIIPLGIEVSAVSCEMSRAKGIEVLQLDITREDIPTSEVFDYIIIVEALEHLSNPVEVLVRLKSHFRCKLLVEIPNTGAINDRLRLIFGRFPMQWIMHPSEHLSFWTVTDFLFLCRQLGFHIEKYYGIHEPYYNFGFIKLWKWYPRLFARFVLYEIS